MARAQIKEIILTDRGTAVHARDIRNILYKFSACPLVWTGPIPPKVGLWVTLNQLEERPYGFKANKAFCN